MGETCWADANVTQPGTFAPRPDMYTEHYQWGVSNAWNPINPALGITIPGWSNSVATNMWVPTPCPEGWRLPTSAEMTALHNLSGDYSSRGGYWAAAGSERGNEVAGRFYGAGAAASNPANPNATALPQGLSICQLPGTMTGCIFLPAVGRRRGTDGAGEERGVSGLYWGFASNVTLAPRLGFTSSLSLVSNYDKALGHTLRCVQ